MNVILQRDRVLDSGIFGFLYTEEYKYLMLTLQRGFVSAKGNLISKIPAGVYTCKRGMHILASMDKPFETFEIMGVKGHYGILFHSANYDYELDGCVALGIGFGTRSNGGLMITNSKKAFAEFMAMQKNVDEFKLIVEGKNLGGTGKGKEFVKNLELARSDKEKAKLTNSSIISLD